MRWRAFIASVAVSIVIGACSSPASTSPAATAGNPGSSSVAATVVWPAPSNPMQLAQDAGLAPETKESLTFHVHAHLDLFVDGAPVVVPAGIGIDITNPGVQHGTSADGSDAYGGISGCDQPCISPLHTHDTSGVLHTESANSTPNTLGQFFTEWGVTLSTSCVGQLCRPAKPIAIYLDGTAYAGDPTTIGLTDKLEIAIVVGTPPAVIPSAFPGA
jgi:hypothetical protein